jgi:hypothetical protein
VPLDPPLPSFQTVRETLTESMALLKHLSLSEARSQQFIADARTRLRKSETLLHTRPASW